MIDIEVRRLKIFEELTADDALAFSCEVYVNGRLAFLAVNRGAGCPNEYQVCEPVERNSWLLQHLQSHKRKPYDLDWMVQYQIELILDDGRQDDATLAERRYGGGKARSVLDRLEKGLAMFVLQDAYHVSIDGNAEFGVEVYRAGKGDHVVGIEAAGVVDPTGRMVPGYAAVVLDLEPGIPDPDVQLWFVPRQLASGLNLDELVRVCLQHVIGDYLRENF